MSRSVVGAPGSFSSSHWQDTGLDGPLVPPPAALEVHHPHFPADPHGRMAGNSEELVINFKMVL